MSTRYFDGWETVENIARELGVTSEATRKWHERRRIPYVWRTKLLEAFATRGVRLNPTFFDQFPIPSIPTPRARSRLSGTA